MIGERIKNARKAKGLSQEEMAERLHVVRQTVSKWENGLSVPDADVLVRIADLLEVPAVDLLDVKTQGENQNRQANRIRGLILFLSFAALLTALHFRNPYLSVILTGGCVLAALMILYRNLALLTPGIAADRKTGPLKITTIFSMAIWILTVTAVVLNQASVVELSGSMEKLAALAVTSLVIMFGGIISPRLPFNRHTGLRLPWTVLDEDTWNLAHKIIGYISFPIELLYLAAAFTISDFEAVSIAAVGLWIGIPAVLSYVFWRRKIRGRV